MPSELPQAAVDGMAVFLLVFFRMIGVVLAAPLFSNNTFPAPLRVGLAFFVAVATFPLAWGQAAPGAFAHLFAREISAALAVAGELAVGWTLGFCASVLIWGAQLAGHIIGQEIGLSIGEVFDPVTQAQGSSTAQFLFTIGLLAFVVLGGHRLVLLAVARSFQVAPPGAFPFDVESAGYVTAELGGEIWRIGLRIALPSMVALLLVTVGMAILARAVPEMNIFILGFALRVIGGLLATLLVLPFVGELLRGFVRAADGFLERLLSLWGG